MKEKLLEILYRRSFRYDPDFGFTLASGNKSDIYVDVKKTILSAEAMELAGRVVFDMISGDDIKGIGGLTLGADPIAYSTAMIANIEGKPLDVFVARKEPKKHGTMRWIEGSLTEGDPVIVVDDVATTGGSTIKAIERAREGGLVVKRVIAFVDREEGGAANIEEASGLKLESVFTRGDLLKLNKG